MQKACLIWNNSPVHYKHARHDLHYTMHRSDMPAAWLLNDSIPPLQAAALSICTYCHQDTGLTHAPLTPELLPGCTRVSGQHLQKPAELILSAIKVL
jgi:hypothetical protein